MDEATIPLHLEPIQQSDVCDKRLWIGNLDVRINDTNYFKSLTDQSNYRYQLLKMVRVYGCIEKLDMLFHRTGPNVGQPRGFAFVTYKQRTDALAAMTSLNGQMLGTKKLCVKFAKNTSMDDADRPKPELGIAVLAGTNSKNEPKLSKKTAIQSIEAKLKLMENLNAGDEFVVNKLAATEAPVIAQYQSKQSQHQQKSTHYWRRRHPYHKKR